MAYEYNTSTNIVPQAEPVRQTDSVVQSTEQEPVLPAAEQLQVNTSAGGVPGGPQLEFPTYYEPIVDLPATSQVLEKNFGRPQDYIELHIYDLNNNLLLSEEEFTEYTFDPQSTVGNLTSQIDIDPILILNDRGFTTGKYRIVFNIQRKKVFNTYEKPFSIKQISNSRREIKTVVDNIPNEVLDRYIRDFVTELNSSPFFKDFNLNFGADKLVTCINIELNARGRKYEVLFKLYEPLGSDIDVLDTFRLSEDITNRISLDVDLGLPALEDDAIPLRGPNFKIDTRLNNSVPSQFKNYEEILSYQFTSSYENLLSKLENKDILDIDYDYVRPISESFVGESDETSYHFENFVHFSSAVERVKNFHYKLKLVELYDNRLKQINAIPAPTSQTSVVLNNKNEVNTKKQNLIKGFDGYEQFLYYTSGSWATWPKRTVTEPFELYSITSSEAREWLGNENSNSSLYGGQLLSASLFDKQNVDNLNRLTPSFILDNPSNDQYQLFTNMIGHHFDQIWTYIKHLGEINDTHHTRGISKELVYFTLKSLGLETFDQFENDNLIEYILGQGTDFSSIGTGYEVEDGLVIEPSPLNTYDAPANQYLVTASSAGSVAKKDIARSVWKRLYHNAPYLLKTKGTERGLRAIMSCYGIPSTMLNVKEYGGPTKDKTTFKTFTYDKNSLALKGSSYNDGFFIKTDWSSSLTDQISASAKTVEFRIKPKREEPSNSYHLFSLNANRIDSPGVDTMLVLRPHQGGDVYETGDANNYGKLELYIGGNKQSSTEIFPIYNGDFWNIHIGTEEYDSGSLESNIKYGAYQANFNKNILNYTATATINEATRSLTWGDPFSGSGDPSTIVMGGAQHAYFGGMNNDFADIYYDATYQLDGGGALLKNLYYSGSLQNIVYNYGESLSHETLKKHALGPFMYSGNSVSSSFRHVVLRLPLGSNNQKDSSSFHPDEDVDYLGATTSSISNVTLINGGQTTFKWEQIEETHHLTTPDTVGRSMTSLRVRVDSGSIDDDMLSPLVKAETSTGDRQPPDYPDLGVFFSPTNEINEDIIYTLGGFRLDDYIGNPLPSAQTSSFYPDLEEIKNYYFKKVKRRYNYWDYIKLIQYVDHTLFKMIEQWVPFRANTKTGLLIEPHYLERNKFAREIPIVDDGQTMVSGSYTTLNANFGDTGDIYSLTGSSVVATTGPKIKNTYLPEFEIIQSEAAILVGNGFPANASIVPVGTFGGEGYADTGSAINSWYDETISVVVGNSDDTLNNPQITIGGLEINDQITTATFLLYTGGVDQDYANGDVVTIDGNEYVIWMAANTAADTWENFESALNFGPLTNTVNGFFSGLVLDLDGDGMAGSSIPSLIIYQINTGVNGNTTVTYNTNALALASGVFGAPPTAFTGGTGGPQPNFDNALGFFTIETGVTVPSIVEQGTNVTIDIDDYILNEIPNLDQNAEFAQSPIIPYTGTRPTGYMAYRGGTVLGNATVAQKSKIFFASTMNGQQNDF